MKRNPSIILAIFQLLILASCKKEEFQTTPLASLKIVNTVTGGQTVRLGSLISTVANNAVLDFAVLTGNPDIYVWPISDSTKPYYNSSKAVTMADREYYTLFLTGTSTAQEGILAKENYKNYKDSVAGIRFINLSPNSPAVKVTLSTTTGISEFGDVNYKQLSDFKFYPAGSANSSYTFQVRNASTNAILASVTLSGTSVATYVPRFFNITLVFKGNIGGTGVNAPMIVRVNHYL